jgi:hypothetical protein
MALNHVTVEEVRELATLSKGARDAQDLLLNKMKIVDKFDDEKMLTQEAIGTLDTLDASLNNAEFTALRERLAGLPREAMEVVIAVMWIGRGDFAAAEWEAALEAAASRIETGEVDYLAEKGPLHDYLMKGLFQLGLS